MSYTYLLVNLGALLIPFAFSFHPKLQFVRAWKAFWPACLVVAAIFLVWDHFYTTAGVWGFNPDYVVGIYVGDLPLEEVLFFICIPYACVFTYHCFTLLLKSSMRKLSMPFTIILGSALLIDGIVFIDNLYTAAAMIPAGILMFVHQFATRSDWLGKFYFTWLILLIPFFIVNGILTGTGLDAPVVWYDDTENHGIRLLTIPIEDLFYGLSMILLNVSLFEWFKKWFRIA